MAIDIALLKTPHDISLSGNPMPFSLAVFPYTDSERNSDIRVLITVKLEVGYNSNTWQEVKSQTFYPGTDGMISVDVQSYVDPYLKYFLPKPGLVQAVEAGEQRKRYKITYLLSRDNAIVVAAQDSPTCTAIKGGMSYDEWHPVNFFSQYLFTNKNFLSFSAAKEKYALEELRFLFFLAPAGGTYTVRFTTVDGNGVIANYGLSGTITATQYSIWCIPAGFNQLPVLTGANLEYCQRYTVAVLNSSNQVVASKTYETDYRNFYDASQLIYRNSAGGLEVIRLRGNIDFEGDYNRQQAVQMVPPSYFSNNTLLAQQVDSAEEQPKFSGDTGFLSRKAADKLRDLFLSPEKWEYANGKLLPISFVTKNVKFFSNRDAMISVLVAWQRAYTNSFYTPAGLLTQNGACPAVAQFKVKQISKNKLQILYALQSPYDAIEVQLIIGANTYTYTYSGNVGSFIQPFTNPVTGAPMDIQVKARTICDTNSLPVNYGPYTTVPLTIIGNNLPVAANDTFNVSAGGSSTTFPQSVLANDYDPDGDPLEAVIALGTTAAGGSYFIGSEGKVTYTPPSAIWTGQDYFDYGAREVGTSNVSTARVFINVGAVAGVVYAKVVLRNVVYNGPGAGATTTAQVWVDFFSDALATQALNVSGLGLTINLRRTQRNYYIDSSGQMVIIGGQTITDSAQAATGTSIKVFEGIIKLDTGSATIEWNYTIRPGQGYSGI